MTGRRRIAGLALIVWLAGLVSCATRSIAHEMHYSRVDLRFIGVGRVECAIALHPEDRALLGALRPEEILASRVRIGGRTLPWRVTRVASEEGGRQILCFATAPAPHERDLAIEAWLVPEDPEHSTYVNVYEGDTARLQDVLDAAHPAARYLRPAGEAVTVPEPASNGGASQRFARFVREGVHHIFIGPDHILFVIGLILTGGGLRRLLKVVTAFTLAHSLTLALCVLGVVAAPASVVEPAIAASVVVVGVENLAARRRGRDIRPALAFCFGLVHGFGFASVLREVGIPGGSIVAPLVAFNIGVEIGQSAIVLATAPLLHAVASRRGGLQRGIVVAGSAGVIVAGSYWLIARALAR